MREFVGNDGLLNDPILVWPLGLALGGFVVATLGLVRYLRNRQVTQAKTITLAYRAAVLSGFTLAVTALVYAVVMRLERVFLQQVGTKGYSPGRRIDSEV